MRGIGYDLHTWHVATQCGATVWASYIVTFCSSHDATNITNDLSASYMNQPRSPYHNVIRTYIIPKIKYHSIQHVTRYKHPTLPNVIGKFK